MKKVAFILYRKWAYDIYHEITELRKTRLDFEIPVLITVSEAEFDVDIVPKTTDVVVLEGKDNLAIDEVLSKYGVEAIFYYGWSWMVKEPILSKYICLCLHPSLLPKYRGGSPIQNQIIAGEIESGVTVFRMGEGLDDGDIYKQIPISLKGSLADIFKEMTEKGVFITKQFISDLIDETVQFIPQQNLDQNPPHKRRRPEDGEIVLSEVGAQTYKDLYNLVRALAAPYPNAFVCLPGGKILIEGIELVGDKMTKGIVLNHSTLATSLNHEESLYLKCADGYVRILHYKLQIP